MADVPFGPSRREPDRHSLPFDLAVVAVPFVLLALLAPVITFLVDRLFSLIG